ncbi:HEAT repeat domain-containing protein [Streptomyces sp. NPDC007157]|uniref:HEAT repeat domain-containing protein n=1 Tax=Streptomyces sp. NPDC007157 TaxID=3154681 RepID=UPI0034065250
MTDTTSGALDGVPWERLESACGDRLTEEMRRALLHLRDKGGAATEEDCDALYERIAPRHGHLDSASTAALPFIVALAGDPGMGARNWLVQLLVYLSRTTAAPEPDQVDPGWHEMWRRQRPALRKLLTDPDPAVRREALPLTDGLEVLLERWSAETDLTVRLPLLLALGAAAAADAGTEAVDRVHAAVREVLRAGPAVMRVAAVVAWAAFDAQAPVRELDLLVEILSDPTVRPRFEDIWYVPDIDDAFSRTDVASWAAGLFGDAPAALRFLVRLIGAARRTGDAALCGAALDEAWRLLVVRPSAAPELVPLAGELLADPDAGVRYRAAHLLAVLGARAAPYAEGLAGLLDDPGEAEDLDGTVGEHARWALTRIGDPRAMPGLVERLHEPYRGQYSRSYTMGDPRRPEVEEVLTPLRAHAEILLPPIRALLREDGAGGPLTGAFLKVLTAWGPAAAPALPEVVALLGDARHSLSALDALVAMGQAAAPAVRGCTALDFPANHRRVAWAAWRLGGDRDTALRLVGEAVLSEDRPYEVVRLGDFGRAALPYADRIRQIMDDGDTWCEIWAAVALWSITGETEPSLSVLEKYVLAVADGDDSFGSFLTALRAVARIGTVSPAVRSALLAVRERDRRLSPYRDYRAFLDDEEIRSVIDEALALPTPPPPSAA